MALSGGGVQALASRRPDRGARREKHCKKLPCGTRRSLGSVAHSPVLRVRVAAAELEALDRQTEAARPTGALARAAGRAAQARLLARLRDARGVRGRRHGHRRARPVCRWPRRRRRAPLEALPARHARPLRAVRRLDVRAHLHLPAQGRHARTHATSASTTPPPPGSATSRCSAEAVDAAVLDHLPRYIAAAERWLAELGDDRQGARDRALALVDAAERRLRDADTRVESLGDRYEAEPDEARADALLDRLVRARADRAKAERELHSAQAEADAVRAALDGDALHGALRSLTETLATGAERRGRRLQPAPARPLRRFRDRPRRRTARAALEGPGARPTSSSPSTPREPLSGYLTRRAEELNLPQQNPAGLPGVPVALRSQRRAPWRSRSSGSCGRAARAYIEVR